MERCDQNFSLIIVLLLAYSSENDPEHGIDCINDESGSNECCIQEEPFTHTLPPSSCMEDLKNWHNFKDSSFSSTEGPLHGHPSSNEDSYNAKDYLSFECEFFEEPDSVELDEDKTSLFISSLSSNTLQIKQEPCLKPVAHSSKDFVEPNSEDPSTSGHVPIYTAKTEKKGNKETNPVGYIFSAPGLVCCTDKSASTAPKASTDSPDITDFVSVKVCKPHTSTCCELTEHQPTTKKDLQETSAKLKKPVNHVSITNKLGMEIFLLLFFLLEFVVIGMCLFIHNNNKFGRIRLENFFFSI